MNVDNPLVHTGKANHLDLIEFLSENNILVPLEGCLIKFDKIAKQFMTAENKQALLEDTEALAKNYEGSELLTADIYVAMMKNILEKGDGFVRRNIDRLTKIANDKNVVAKKKEKMQIKINILRSFVVEEIRKDKEEL